MMSGPALLIIPPATTATEEPRQTLRLKLKPKAPTTGYVDGAWWPRSQDLSTELPALLAVLAIRLGRIQRVSYNLTTWDTAPRRIHIEGKQIRLGGFRTQHPQTVDVIGTSGARLTLLVVPPATNVAAAHQILMTAAQRENNAGINELLSLGAEPGPVTSDLPAPAAQRWELDGGRVHQPA